PPNTLTGASGAAINVNAPITAANISITTTGASSFIDVANPITADTVTLSSKGALTTSAAGVINATTATLTGANINVKTDVTNLKATSTVAGVTINQGAGVLNLTAVLPTVGGAVLNVTSQNQINLTGALNVGKFGVITLDDQSVGGNINIGAPITAGTVNLTTGTGGITSSGGAVVNAGVITLTTTGDVGQTKSPFLVNNNLGGGGGNALTIVVGAGKSVNVTDLCTSDLVLDVSAGTTGSSLTFTTTATTLNVVQAPFDSVSINDTSAFGSIVLNSASNAAAVIGTGVGAVNISTNGDIDMNPSTAGIVGSSVSLVTNAGSIGANSGNVFINTTFVVLEAPAGHLQVTDTAGGGITVVGNSLGRFYFTETGSNADILLTSPISASDIEIHAQGANSNITNTFPLGISASGAGTHVELMPTGNLNVNGPIQADGVFLGGNFFLGPMTQG
ncbi:MAG: hypothetical protein JSS86_22830, partial [Cyanobacteria bacterium SZAS LIN-2]|nr:hypothetical protein [Cyanobacteria bacterium SZAS LIN-2]